MGFDMGQGMYFGAPMSDLPPPPAATANVSARRQGVREIWS
jgi:EAL domain-containing protein (putative c-di-GMP-specific phosphodiesterase class I)